MHGERSGDAAPHGERPAEPGGQHQGRHHRLVGEFGGEHRQERGDGGRDCTGVRLRRLGEKRDHPDMLTP